MSTIDETTSVSAGRMNNRTAHDVRMSICSRVKVTKKHVAERIRLSLNWPVSENGDCLVLTLSSSRLDEAMGKQLPFSDIAVVQQKGNMVWRLQASVATCGTVNIRAIYSTNTATVGSGKIRMSRGNRSCEKPWVPDP